MPGLVFFLGEKEKKKKKAKPLLKKPKSENRKPQKPPKNSFIMAEKKTDEVHIVETQDERLGGPGKCGRLFVQYWMDNGCTTAAEVAKKIPDVDIKFKVKRLSDFDSKRGTFYCDALLMMDWEDESLSIATTKSSPDFFEHFWPKAEIQGKTPDSEAPGMEDLPKYKFDVKKKFGEHRATLTIPFCMVLFARVNFREFPFDHQTLELSLKLLSIRVPGVSKGTRPTARHPHRWRGLSDKKEQGHQLVKDADSLPEYDFVRLSSRAYSSAYGPFIDPADEKKYADDKEKGKLYQDQYTLQIIMVRDSVSVMWNMCFSLFVIDVMVFAAHGIPMSDLADRLSVNLTLLLTAMAFKWVLSDTLPPVPYLTTMEVYVIATFASIWIQGVVFWFLADMYNYRCADKIDYWSGEPLPVNKTVIMDASCKMLQEIDRSVLMFEVLSLVLKNMWFAYRVVVNKKSKVAAETHYVNLGGLSEYTMEENLKFVAPIEKCEMNGISPSKYPLLGTGGSGGGSTKNARVSPEEATK